MKITLSPVRMDLPTPLAASVAGDVLTIDGQRIDFAALAEGDLYPGDELGSPWITSPVERIGGEIRLTLVSPHGGNAPHESRFPAPLTVTSGPVPFPPYGAPEEEIA